MCGWALGLVSSRGFREALLLCVLYNLHVHLRFNAARLCHVGCKACLGMEDDGNFSSVLEPVFSWVAVGANIITFNIHPLSATQQSISDRLALPSPDLNSVIAKFDPVTHVC